MRPIDIYEKKYPGKMSQWLRKCYRGRNLNLEAETIGTPTDMASNMWPSWLDREKGPRTH
jgi:hypothetical protein